MGVQCLLPLRTLWPLPGGSEMAGILLVEPAWYSLGGLMQVVDGVAEVPALCAAQVRAIDVHMQEGIHVALPYVRVVLAHRLPSERYSVSLVEAMLPAYTKFFKLGTRAEVVSF